ncbi:hypothetical protein V6N13_147600 [Hibiscus sabdariffa]
MENRHLANFVPDVWGDTFLAPPPQLDLDDITRSEYQELKEQERDKRTHQVVERKNISCPIRDRRDETTS